LDAYLTSSAASKDAGLYQNDSFGQAGLSGTEKAWRKRNMQMAAKGSFERYYRGESGLAAILGGAPDQ